MRRRLRIAVSVFFALVAVAFCVQWVSSYWWVDNLSGPVSATRRIGIASGSGWITIRWRYNDLAPSAFRKWIIQHTPQSVIDQFYERAISRGETVTKPTYRFGFSRGGAFQLPYAMPVALMIGCSVLLARPRAFHFSTRTLLIATTVVAALLGLAVYHSRL
jgi:hypothetical protein